MGAGRCVLLNLKAHLPTYCKLLDIFICVLLISAQTTMWCNSGDVVEPKPTVLITPTRAQFSLPLATLKHSKCYQSQTPVQLADGHTVSLPCLLVGMHLRRLNK